MHLVFLSPQRGLSESLRLLYDGLRARGHQLELWDSTAMTWRVGPHGLTFWLEGHLCTKPDLLYWWHTSEALGAQRLVEAMAAAAWPLFHSPHLPQSDKLTQAYRLGAAGLPIPATLLTTPDLLASAGAGLIWPQVVKAAHGARGERVALVPDVKAAQEQAQRWGLGNDDPLIVQEPIPPLGEDVRAFLVQGQLLAAMSRHAPPGQFLANIARGGEGRPTTLSPHELQLCQQAWQAMGAAPWAGVDFIRSPTGPVFLEVNLWPGFQGLRQVFGDRIVSALVGSLEAVGQASSAGVRPRI